MKNLNESEQQILQSLIDETLQSTGGEFGYMEDVSRGNFTKHQFAGYISSLRKKGYFDYLSNEFNGQFALKEFCY